MSDLFERLGPEMSIISDCMLQARHNAWRGSGYIAAEIDPVKAAQCERERAEMDGKISEAFSMFLSEVLKGHEIFSKDRAALALQLCSHAIGRDSRGGSSEAVNCFLNEVLDGTRDGVSNEEALRASYSGGLPNYSNRGFSNITGGTIWAATHSDVHQMVFSLPVFLAPDCVEVLRGRGIDVVLKPNGMGLWMRYWDYSDQTKSDWDRSSKKDDVEEGSMVDDSWPRWANDAAPHDGDLPKDMHVFTFAHVSDALRVVDEAGGQLHENEKKPRGRLLVHASEMERTGMVNKASCFLDEIEQLLDRKVSEIVRVMCVLEAIFNGGLGHELKNCFSKYGDLGAVDVERNMKDFLDGVKALPGYKEVLLDLSDFNLSGEFLDELRSLVVILQSKLQDLGEMIGPMRKYKELKLSRGYSVESSGVYPEQLRLKLSGLVGNVASVCENVGDFHGKVLEFKAEAAKVVDEYRGSFYGKVVAAMKGLVGFVFGRTGAVDKYFDGLRKEALMRLVVPLDLDDEFWEGVVVRRARVLELVSARDQDRLEAEQRDLEERALKAEEAREAREAEEAAKPKPAPEKKGVDIESLDPEVRQFLTFLEEKRAGLDGAKFRLLWNHKNFSRHLYAIDACMRIPAQTIKNFGLDPSGIPVFKSLILSILRELMPEIREAEGFDQQKAGLIVFLEGIEAYCEQGAGLFSGEDAGKGAGEGVTGEDVGEGVGEGFPGEAFGEAAVVSE